MKPTLSVLMPGIRTERWQAVYDSIRRSCDSSFELIAVGPKAPEHEIYTVEGAAFSFIQDYGSPIRCQQIGLVAAQGTFVTWASDDGIFEPDALDKMRETAYRAPGGSKDAAVNTRYTEGDNPENWAVQLKDEYYYFRGFADWAGLNLPAHYLAFNGPYLMNRETLLALGGWDCQFDTIAVGYCDLGARWQNAGLVTVLEPYEAVKFGHMPGETGDHGPVCRAHTEHDMPLFRKLHALEAPLRTAINLNNWKHSPSRWERRFGK